MWFVIVTTYKNKRQRRDRNKVHTYRHNPGASSMSNETHNKRKLERKKIRRNLLVKLAKNVLVRNDGAVKSRDQNQELESGEPKGGLSDAHHYVGLNTLPAKGNEGKSFIHASKTVKGSPSCSAGLCNSTRPPYNGLRQCA